ncbi:MAG: protein kinase domain-containing protein [Planctomycetota bacterium]|jgi:WD40 repeat protein/serine/threonine protein kinase
MKDEMDDFASSNLDGGSARDKALAREAIAGLPGMACSRPVHFRSAIDGYEPVSIHHQGGQGVVYIANQRSTGREVAIKLLRYGDISTPMERGRFEREIRVLSQLKHPSLVTIHDSGSADGLPYIVMDFVDGVHLDAYVEEVNPSREELLSLLKRIAEAVQAAHVRGVIHRDLKPANILIDEDGRPVIVDFGLAKLDEDNSSSPAITLTGAFIGSVPWSSPEQARGEHDAVDVRTDVYALGVIFWHVWTGVFPYEVHGNAAEVLRQITTVDPSRPGPCRYELDQDLETILRKCLSKQQERRYGSAGELADDLDSLQQGKPISARRDNAAYVFKKYIARHQIVSAMALLLLLVILSSSLVFQGLYRNADSLRAIADRKTYMASLSAAHAGIAVRDAIAAQDALDLAPESLRGWEWAFLQDASDESVMTMSDHSDVINAVAWFADGTRIVSGSDDRTVRVTSVPDGGEVLVLVGHTDKVFDVAVNSNGTLIASGSRDWTVRIWDAVSGSLIKVLNLPERVTDVEFSPDGTEIAAAASYSGIVQFWDVDSLEEPFAQIREPNRVECIAYSPDGTLIATGAFQDTATHDSTIRIYDRASGAILHELDTGTSRVCSIAFSPDGNQIGAATHDGRVFIWSYQLESAELVFIQEKGAPAYEFVFMGNGSKVLSGGYDRDLNVFDAESAEPLNSFMGHRKPITGIAVSHDDTLVATASMDGTVKIWEFTHRPPHKILTDHEFGVGRIAFSTDGAFLVSTSADPAMGVWNTSDWTLIQMVRGEEAITNALALDGETSVVYTGQLSPQNQRIGTIHAWNEHWEPEVFSNGLPSVWEIAINPNCQALYAAFGESNQPRRWDLQSREEIQELSSIRGCGTSMISSPVGNWIAGSCGQWILIHDCSTDEVVYELGWPFPESNHIFSGLAFSHDARLLAAGSTNGQIAVWDMDEDQLLYIVNKPDDPRVNWIAFHPNGERLAAATQSGVVLYDGATGDRLLSFRNLGDAGFVAFSPDGRHMAASSRDSTIHVWSAPDASIDQN